MNSSTSVSAFFSSVTSSASSVRRPLLRVPLLVGLAQGDRLGQGVGAGLPALPQAAQVFLLLLDDRLVLLVLALVLAGCLGAPVDAVGHNAQGERGHQQADDKVAEDQD